MIRRWAPWKFLRATCSLYVFSCRLCLTCSSRCLAFQAWSSTTWRWRPIWPTWARTERARACCARICGVEWARAVAATKVARASVQRSARPIRRIRNGVRETTRARDASGRSRQMHLRARSHEPFRALESLRERAGERPTLPDVQTVLDVSNEVAAELAGIGDGVLNALRDRLGCTVNLRGNRLTLAGDDVKVAEAQAVVEELVELVEGGQE